LDNNEFSGLTISSPLFFKPDESIDYETLGRYLDDVCANKYISAVYSMAYNTRYRMLSDHELLELNVFIINRVKNNGHKVYVGHPYTFTRDSLNKYLLAISVEEPNGISMLYPERYYGYSDPILEFMSMPITYGLNVVLHEMKMVSGFDGGLMNWPDTLLEEVFDKIPLVAVKEDSKSDEITSKVLELCNFHNVHCVLAGGGKQRAIEFLDQGLETWLNGSTMFLPHLIDQTYEAFTTENKHYQQLYLENIEKPFFDDVVSIYGWHLGHKAALEYFGYGERNERFPHAILPDKAYQDVIPVFQSISSSLDLFTSVMSASPSR